MSTHTSTPPARVTDQPVSNVVWLPRTQLQANDWNPNKQAPPEHRLLKTSILENGWTQPIVVRDHGNHHEIVDGFHRWTISERSDVQNMTDDFVPVVVLPPTDDATARMSTIRHNRARGTHHVLGMADVVAQLIELGLSPTAISQRLEMDSEEVARLSDRGDMLKRHAPNTFNQGWTVS